MKRKDKIKDYLTDYCEPTVELVSELFIEETAGAIIPGVTSFIRENHGVRNLT